jgi:tellurite resistance-related uncharacterized protein
MAVERPIVGYHCDEQGDWVAELGCGHGQHVRHRPPFRPRPWVVDVQGRTARLETPLECPLCDRAELPIGLNLVRSSPTWDEHTIPRAILRAHRIASGTWGRIVVKDGTLRFVAHRAPEIDVVLGPGSIQAIPPDVDHEVQPLGSVHFLIDFLSVPMPHRRGAAGTDIERNPPERNEAPPGSNPQRSEDQGGETACWAYSLSRLWRGT